MEKWLSLGEACQTLGVSERTLQRRIKEGKFPTKREGKRRYVLVDVQEENQPDGGQIPDIPDTVSLIDKLESEAEDLRKTLSDTQKTLADTQLSLHDTQREFNESRQRSDSIIMQLSKTVDNQQLQIQDQTFLIENLRQPKPLWRRWFGRQPSKVQSSVT